MEYCGLTLDSFQEAAIGFLDEGSSVLVSAPTGTGKTLIADFLVEKALKSGKQVIYTAPVKALSNQKYRDYCRLHGESNVGLVTGDLVIRRDAPCLVMTTEILRNMLLTGDPIGGLAAVVLDEIHFLDDRERGTVWEEVLIYLPPSVQILGLSATLANLEEFADWLSAVRGTRVETIRHPERSVPLHVMLASHSTGLAEPKAYEEAWRRWRKRENQDTRPAKRSHRHRGKGGRRHKQHSQRRGRPTRHTQIFEMLRGDMMPYLYFVFSRRSAEACARGLGQRAGRSLLDKKRQEQMRLRLREAMDVVGPEVIDDELYDLYMKGIAFHHAGLHVQLKALVEELYENKLIDVLYTTSTFALGINMPARTVVLDALEKYDGRGTRPLTVREFMQKAGRAGRRGMDTVGYVVVRMDFDKFSESRTRLGRYLDDEPEGVDSSFNLSFNSIVNLLERLEKEQIRDMVERSFLSWRLQRKAEGIGERVNALEASLKEDGWTPDAKDLSPALRRKARELRRLRRRASRAPGRAWADFLHRRQFLKEIGYLAEDGSFNAGARILRHIQIEEIFTTELVLSGLVEELPSDLLFGVLCAMTNDLAPTVRISQRLQGEARNVAKQVNAIRFGDTVLQAERLMDNEVNWDPNLMLFGRAWANGQPLVELGAIYESPTDISGQLISGFRRAKDLASQIRHIYREDDETFDRLSALMRSVSRDEVEVVD
ncbi:MAG: DEAD/DEAH box helicase [Myxococcota bacterium]|nr:DEAD/DEAH box helicase [Myxococcota bacterium]